MVRWPGKTFLVAVHVAPALIAPVVAGVTPIESDRGPALHVLAYHDVRDDVAGDVDADQYAISTSRLIDHFNWLREHDFTPVGVDRILAASSGGPPLPERAVLLTFDDGLKSAYTHVLPLLEIFEYPAVVSVVTGWIESDAIVEHAGRTLTSEDFLSWDEIRDLGGSGLVEIASHTHDLHRGITANPQGNQEPAAVSRLYTGGRYERDETYVARIRDDLAQSAAALRAHTGRAPRIITWPYGAYDTAGLAAARQLGMSLSLTLTAGRNTEPFGRILGRHLMLANPGISALSLMLLHPAAPPIVRAAQIDLDYVYDPDPRQQEENLGRLLDRVKALGISHVFLQAFADPDADGGADALYFPNRHLPVRADLFNRAAWQLKTRAGVLVYGWLPMLAYSGAGIDPGWRALQIRDGELSVDANAEPRLSVFEPRARALISEIYADLAVHAHFDGLLFHDDGRLNEHEDANPAATGAYRAALGPDFSIERARREPDLGRRFAAFKTRALIDFSHALAAAVREHRPEIRTARNLFASALLDESGERYLGQSLEPFLAAYDHVALMAMPYLEGAARPQRFYRDLVAAVAARPGALGRTIFELQTVDWRGARSIDAGEVAATMRELQALGVRHLAYYPDDFVRGHPELEMLRGAISLARFPSGDAR